ncbi:hypothetical protein PSMK_06030 [Phycisphaera mikurensis NBRC 102666]|uniref:Uncharacterized protein n=1 Tax=Phycisphaera mikurensis (strain NBRC 102666 / KCTC 22515 / FYK2301M01) TaxID=1142394 RepID=I0IBX4_PHYMF|nr:hypothetical protein PSMK_06030 [Phycisphaera mikurensis NBRC 102666]
MDVAAQADGEAGTGNHARSRLRAVSVAIRFYIDGVDEPPGRVAHPLRGCGGLGTRMSWKRQPHPVAASGRLGFNQLLHRRSR